MKRSLVIAALNTDPYVARKLQRRRDEDRLDLKMFRDRETFIGFVNYELPELTVYNFAEAGLEAYDALADIRSDPWLHYGGVIALCLSAEEEKIASLLKGTNLVALIRVDEFDRYFPRLLKIIKKNRQFLFQWHLQKHLITELSGSFVLDNDPFDLAAYANLIVNYLANADYIDAAGKERLKLALHELLINAVEHGNCAIGYEEKSAWLEAHRDIFDLIREKKRNPAVRAKKVTVKHHITPARSRFTIADRGRGFDWKKSMGDKPHADSIEELSLHGRGIALAGLYARDLSYNKKGNAVSFTFPHEPGGVQPGPALFDARRSVVFKHNQVVFRENDESDCLYYIVSGRLDVYVEGKKLAALTPRDVFVGEMSFLLSNRRTATVKSSGRSVLLVLSKREFLAAMRTQPHYSIFLARLLAQRLEKLNRKVGRLL